MERLVKILRPASLPALPVWVGTLITFNIVTSAWIFFRAKEFVLAQEYLAGIMRFDSSNLELANPWMVALIVLGMACHFGPTDAIERMSAMMRRLPAWVFAAAGVLVLLVIEGLRGVGVAPFIYFQF